MKMLEDYYGEHAYAMLSQGMESGLDERGQPEEPAAMRKLADQVARAVLWEGKFVLAFIGSSVMCGHDNCFYDNYPNQLHRLLKSAFEKIGAPLELRNAGQGGRCGDTQQNQVFCLSTLVGEDVDLVHYSWTYYEAGTDAVPYHELVARWAATLPHAAPVHFMNTGGWDPKTPQRVPKTQDRFRHKATGDARLPAKYKDFALNGVSMERGLAFNGKFMGRVWGQVGDGLHNVTRYGASERNPVRRRALGIVFRNWHPGPLGFQYVADVFAYHYFKALRVAAEMLAAAGASGLAQRWPRETYLTGRDLPEPLTKLEPREMYLLPSPPSCLTMVRPIFGKNRVFLGDPEDSANPYRGKVTRKPSWQQWQEETPEGMVPKEERKITVPEPGCMHQDSCGALKASRQADGYQTFMLPKMSVGFLAVCGHGRKALEKSLARPEVQFELAGRRLDKAAMANFSQAKCLILQRRWSFPVDDSHGHLFLAVFLEQSSGDAPPVAISQVIAF